MSSPCNYEEAWGSLTSNKIPIFKKKIVNAPKSNPPNIFNINKKSEIECSDFLLHFITCKHCQQKIKELSNSFSHENSTNKNTHENQHMQFQEQMQFNKQQHQQHQQMHNPHLKKGKGTHLSNNYLSEHEVDNYREYKQIPSFIDLNINDKMNETLLYILIGLMVGYILSQILSKK
jgi:hypothetical protein